MKLLLGVATLSLALAGTAAMAQAPAAKPAGPPPIEAFFDEGSVLDMRLSPNQRWLASRVVPEGGGLVRLVVSDLHDKEPARVVATFSRANVDWFRWVNDELLVVEVADKDRAGVRDGELGGLVSVTLDGKTMRHLVKANWDTLFPAQGMGPLEANHRFVSLGEPGSDDIVLSVIRYERGGPYTSSGLLLMNARTGTRRSLVKSVPDDVWGYLFDPRGQPRVARAYRDGQTTLYWYDAAKESWRAFANHKAMEAPFVPQFVDGKGQLYVTVALPGGTGEELRRFDFEAGAAAEVVASTPGFDSGFEPLMDRRGGELLGLRVRLDAPESVWFKPSIAELQKKVDERLRGRVNRLLCERCDEQEQVLVFSSSDRAPGDFVLFNTRTRQLQLLGSRRPALDPAAMAPVHYERIQARDGRPFPVYVTLPGGAAAKSLPAVLLVHGGPNVRGRDWLWDAEAQFLASRGYVVIEPEFRGSAGYGDAHYRAGFRQWGLSMQDDLSDAVAWAVKKGWVDRSRVCIAGASYGGYATLMGLAKTPEAFRCGVAWVGVSDIDLMFSAHWSDVSRSTKQHSMRETIGDPVKDAAALAAVSPINLADRIKAPVLLAYGALDLRVPIDHGERMRAALKKAGNEPEWVVYDEGHGWFMLQNRKDFWGRVERFLEKNLKP